MMVKSSFRRCKRRGVAARGKLSVRRWIRKGSLSTMRLKQRLSVLFAWRCICRTSPRLRRIANAANTAPTAEGQMLVLLRLDQSRAKGSGSDAMAF